MAPKTANSKIFRWGQHFVKFQRLCLIFGGTRYKGHVCPAQIGIDQSNNQNGACKPEIELAFDRNNKFLKFQPIFSGGRQSKVKLDRIGHPRKHVVLM